MAKENREYFDRVKTMLKTKKNPQVTDPVRYPKVINGYEDSIKRQFAVNLNIMFSNISSRVIKMKK